MAYNKKFSIGALMMFQSLIAIGGVTGFFPDDSDPVFNYRPVSPYLQFSALIEPSGNFRQIVLTDEDDHAVDGEAYITGEKLVFVPAKTLEGSKSYTLEVPPDAVRVLGEGVFRGYYFTFSTPVSPLCTGVQGDATIYVLNEDGSLGMSGMEYLGFTPDDGSYTYVDREGLTDVRPDVEAIACGYTHSLIRHGSGISTMGISFCGENGTLESIAEIGSAETVRAGFQTSAIIDEDGSLWMCGRNDFYQLANGTGTTSREFIKVADAVVDVALGYGHTLYVDADNCLWAVGRNHKGQLGDGSTMLRSTPVKIMEGVEKVYASICGDFSACISTDGTLYTWGDNSSGQLGRSGDAMRPGAVPVAGTVVVASLGGAHMCAITENGDLYAWGDVPYSETGSGNRTWRVPHLMTENVVSVSAGPQSILVVHTSGRVGAWGRFTHSSLGTDILAANDYTFIAGRECMSLDGVRVEPTVHEAEEGSRFALVAIPVPLQADYDVVEWSTDNPSVATVDDKGVVSTGNLGEAIVTVRLSDRQGKTTEASAKIICTQNPDNTGIISIDDGLSQWGLAINGLSLVVTNATPGAEYILYNFQGIAVGSARASSGSLIFELPSPGAYIIRCGTRALKTVCR